MKKALVRTPIIFIMKEAREDSERIDEGLYGMELKILRHVEKDWLKIETSYHYTGYVQRKDLLFDEKQITFWEKLDKSIVVNSFTDVLIEAKIQSPLLLTIPRGGIVGVLFPYNDNGFLQIYLCDGTIGYIRESHIKRMNQRIIYQEEEELRRNLIRTAYSYIGTGYRWGGKTPLGIDCSGLCFMAYYLNGISIYRDAAIKEGSDGVVINSLNYMDLDFRKDLLDKMLAIGSVFGG